MTSEKNKNAQERPVGHSASELVVIDLETCSATDHLAETLMAVHLAFDLMAAVPHAVCILPDDATWKKLMELQDRHQAGILPVLSAVEAVESSGDEIV